MTDVTSLDDARTHCWAFRRRGMVLLASALGLGLVIGLSSAFGGDPAAGLSLPGSDSQQAPGLLEERFPAQSGDRMDVVVHANAVTSREVQGRIETPLVSWTVRPTLRRWRIRTGGRHVPARAMPRRRLRPRPARDSTNPKGVCPCVRSSPHWRHC
jgi:hypothetical protein